MMCAPSAKIMEMHSTREDNRSISEIPQSVLEAERWLKKHAARFHYKISGYRNRGHLSKDEADIIELYAISTSTIWIKVFPFLLKFIGCETLTEYVEHKTKTRRSISTNRKITWKEQRRVCEKIW